MKVKSLLIKIFLSLAVLVVVALKVDFAQVRDMAANIHPSSWVYAIVFILLQIAALAVRWRLLVNVNTITPLSLPTALRITSVSFLANYLFITSIGGIISRIGLTMSHGFSFVKSLAATIIDRGMTLLALIILALIFVPMAGNYFGDKIETTLGLLATLAILCLTVLLVLYRYRRAIIFSHRKITVCFKYLRALLTDPARLTKIIAMSLISQLMYFASVYVVVYSLGAEFSFVKFMAIMPMITILSSLPIGYGGWGIREGAFIYGLGLINMPAETAFIASVQIGLISMITAVISGVPSFISSETQSSLKKLKSLKKRPAIQTT